MTHLQKWNTEIKVRNEPNFRHIECFFTFFFRKKVENVPKFCTFGCFFKGALDKYNIYLFISNVIEDFKLNQYRRFQLILPMHFHFMRYFVNIIISIIEVDFEKNRKC